MIDVLQASDLDNVTAEDLSVLLIEEMLVECPGVSVQLDTDQSEDYVEIVVRVPR